MTSKFKKCLGFSSSWAGVIAFILCLLTVGQVISFLNSELMGFLHVTFYFILFPIAAAVLLIINLASIFAQKSEKYISIVFSIILGIYLGILWKFPLAGALAFFLADYAKISIIARCLVLLLTVGLWVILFQKVRKAPKL